MNGKNPTRKQKEYLTSKHLNCKNWLICKDTPTETVIKHRLSGKTRIIKKMVS